MQTLLSRAQNALVTLALLSGAANAQAQSSAELPRKLPKKMQCEALQTVGLHDYAGAPESYEPSTFFESKFELRINSVLTRHLAARTQASTEATPDLFLTMRPRNAKLLKLRPIELRCRQIQGYSGELGFSCSNTPPSELLLINPGNLRFTRTSIGGWTFSDIDPSSNKEHKDLNETADKQGDEDIEQTDDHLGDDSLFVEYGTCRALK